MQYSMQQVSRFCISFLLHVSVPTWPGATRLPVCNTTKMFISLVKALDLEFPFFLNRSVLLRTDAFDDLHILVTLHRCTDIRRW